MASLVIGRNGEATLSLDSLPDVQPVGKWEWKVSVAMMKKFQVR
jgi:hypothetical protein